MNEIDKIKMEYWSRIYTNTLKRTDSNSTAEKIANIFISDFEYKFSSEIKKGNETQSNKVLN